MANQSIGTPRFYLDFTQLAKAKGFRVDDGTDQTIHMDGINAPKNLNVWDFDYTNPTNYTSDTATYANFTFKCPPFWDTDLNVVEDVLNLEWCKLMSTANFAGVINHNLYTSVKAVSDTTLKISPHFHGGEQTTYLGTIDDIINARDIHSDGYSFFEWTTNNYYPISEPYRYSRFNIQFINADGSNPIGADVNFDIGALTFGKYIDMPNSPDLNVRKTVEYDGVNIKRSLGGADFVQVNHQGQPDWLVGEPWTLKDYASNGRVGRNGRRSWDLNFSYLSNDDVFYDLNERVVGGSAMISDGVELAFNPTSEIQQIWDLTLGGALSFAFTPDKDATNPEFAVCRLDQDSLVATQVAFQTWNISMRVVEVW